MTVRVGVDVGGTFTKAVAFDLSEGKVIAQAAVATTHHEPAGVAAGVAQALRQVAEKVGPERIELVAHSTTQAVNALLEGDVAPVGVIGMGRQPELRRAKRRTRLDGVELSEDRSLSTVGAFIDVTGGLDLEFVRAELERLVKAGVTSVCIAEAFATEDGFNEREVARLALEMGIPATTSSELSGLYGLELRAVTAAVNSSILPIALKTAGFIEASVRACGIEGPVMVMRGDGGVTDLEGFRRAPARTLYSGPAASVAGVLRHVGADDAVVVEVGGTSTNVAAIKNGRPLLSYVKVASHATALRALDVRVVGVAGGSMLKTKRGRMHGVGPRSAHIAGLAYSCFLTPGELEGAEAAVVAPCPGDVPDYLVLQLTDGRSVALTNTCAANALGVVEPGDYAFGNAEAASAAFEIAGQTLRLPGPELARRMIEASGQAVAALVASVAAEHELMNPLLIAVGGGAGGLGRHVAAIAGLPCSVPEGAEVVSSIGDALSFVRAEKERTINGKEPTEEEINVVISEAETEALRSGAGAGSIQVQWTHDAERATLRATAIGTVELRRGAQAAAAV